MDQNGFDFKALRMNIAPTASTNPPFSVLQKQQQPQTSRKPFSFVKTQSRNNVENQPTRMKQEPTDHHLAFSNARHTQPSFIPQPRNEPKSQCHPQSLKLRAFTTYVERSSQPPFPVDVPQYTSSPKPSLYKGYPESQTHGLHQPQEPRHPSSSIPHSRSPSVQFDQDLDAEDADLSQLMNKRMRETKLIKAKLAEQRHATAALESRLSAQTAASEVSELALKIRISELEALEATRQAKDDELQTVKVQAAEAERKLQEATSRLNDMRATAKSGLVEVTSNYTALQGHFEDLKATYSASQEAVKRLSDEVSEFRQSVLQNVNGLDASEKLCRSVETRALIDDLQCDRTNAHQVIDMLRDKLHLLSAQVVEAKERIKELEAVREGKIERVESKVEELADRLIKKEEEDAKGLGDAVALEAQLDETSEKLGELSKTLEQREAELGALREQKVASEREARENRATIASLQSVASENTVLREESKTYYQEKTSSECQVKEMSSRLSVLQTAESDKIALEYEVRQARSKIAALQALDTEVVALREEIVTLECQAKESRSKIAALQSAETELLTVKERKVALEFEVKEIRSKAAALEDSLESTCAKLQQSRDRRHEQDIKLGELQAELKAVGSVKDQLCASLEATQQSANKLTADVHTLTLREAVLQQKCEDLAGQVGKLGVEASVREEEIQRVNTRSSVLQERFDSQAVTLKLAKEQSGDLQERLLMSETAHATKLESVTGKLNIELAVLKEQNANLQVTLLRVREDAATQQAGFLGVSSDYENKLAKLEETHVKLVQAETQRAVIAERETADAKRLAADLAQRAESGRAEAEEVKRKAREVVSKESLGMEGEVVVLRARLEELEGEYSRLQHRAKNLNKRYKDGDLSDVEKNFVNSLMQLSQSVHEQDIVAKENELRRRDNMITSLQTRINTLESTLARMLKEKGKGGDPNSKSMVDLTLWMSSSPRSAQKQAEAHPTTARIAPDSPTVFVPDTPPVVRKSAETAAVAATKQQPPHTAHSTYKSLASIDAEDDVLTESDDDDKPLSTLGKRSRTPTSAKTEASRPLRRSRTAARKAEAEIKKPAAEGVAKSKQRKRR